MPGRSQGNQWRKLDQAGAVLLKSDVRLNGEPGGIGIQRFQKSLHFDPDQFVS